MLNDDLRDVTVDYPRMSAIGFRFLRVDCDEPRRHARLGRRRDLATVADSSTTDAIGAIRPDGVIDNATDDTAVLHRRVAAVLEALL